MIRIQEIVEHQGRGTLKMTGMAPLQVARICDEGSAYNGDIVMRTASENNFEVFNLSSPGQGKCWGAGQGKCWDAGVVTMVNLLPVGKKVILTVSNEE